MTRLGHRRRACPSPPTAVLRARMESLSGWRPELTVPTPRKSRSTPSGVSPVSGRYHGLFPGGRRDRHDCVSRDRRGGPRVDFALAYSERAPSVPLDGWVRFKFQVDKVELPSILSAGGSHAERSLVISMGAALIFRPTSPQSGLSKLLVHVVAAARRLCSLGRYNGGAQWEQPGDPPRQQWEEPGQCECTAEGVDGDIPEERKRFWAWLSVPAQTSCFLNASLHVACWKPPKKAPR